MFSHLKVLQVGKAVVLEGGGGGVTILKLVNFFLVRNMRGAKF